MTHGYSQDKAKLSARLSRIEGQVRGVSRMVAEDKYCIDILTQITSIKAAIDQVAILLLEDHVKVCVVDAVREGNTDKVEELVEAVARFSKS